eukprot:scaffold13779_cov54-Phaeocystis_antarctica.AAC.2
MRPLSRGFHEIDQPYAVAAAAVRVAGSVPRRRLCALPCWREVNARRAGAGEPRTQAGELSLPSGTAGGLPDYAAPPLQLANWGRRDRQADKE